MLWFFGLLSVTAFVCTLLLWLRDRGNAARNAPCSRGGRSD